MNYSSGNDSELQSSGSTIDSHVVGNMSLDSVGVEQSNVLGTNAAAIEHFMDFLWISHNRRHPFHPHISRYQIRHHGARDLSLTKCGDLNEMGLHFAPNLFVISKKTPGQIVSTFLGVL